MLFNSSIMKSNWSRKIQRFFFNFQNEVFKTSEIGKRMLTASRTNAFLRETYEQLGREVEKSLEDGSLEWNSEKAEKLLHTIKACKQDLEEIQREVNRLKMKAGPSAPIEIDRL